MGLPVEVLKVTGKKRKTSMGNGKRKKRAQQRQGKVGAAGLVVNLGLLLNEH